MRELVAANIDPHPDGMSYTGGSALHDPLTVLHALALEGEGSKFFDLARARVRVDHRESGLWKDVQVSGDTLARAVNANGDCSPLQLQWWEESKRFVGELQAGDSGNCDISFGTASDSQMECFWRAMAAVLVPASTAVHIQKS